MPEGDITARNYTGQISDWATTDRLLARHVDVSTSESLDWFVSDDHDTTAARALTMPPQSKDNSMDDPDADRYLMWDDSEAKPIWTTVAGSGDVLHTEVSTSQSIGWFDAHWIDSGSDVVSLTTATADIDIPGGEITAAALALLGNVTESDNIYTTNVRTTDLMVSDDIDCDQIFSDGNGGTSGTWTVGNYTLPTADGTNGQVLKTNGSGTVSWDDDSGNGGGGGVVVLATLQ